MHRSSKHTEYNSFEDAHCSQANNNIKGNLIQVETSNLDNFLI